MRKFNSLLFVLCLIGGFACSKPDPELLPENDSFEKLYLYSTKVDGGIYPDYKVYGYVNKEQEVIIDAKYDFAKPFERGVAKVAKIKKVPDRWNRGQREQLLWGLIDANDSVLIDFEYFELKTVFNNNYTGLGLTNSYLFNDKGDTLKILLHNWEDDHSFNDSLIFVKNSTKRVVGLMDSAYNYFVEPKFKWISESEENSFRFSIQLKAAQYLYGYLDSNGNQLLPANYIMAGPFKKRKAIVQDTLSQKIKLIDREGNMIALLDDFIDSLVTNNYQLNTFNDYKNCIANLNNAGLWFAVRDCRGTLFNKKIYSNYTEQCPHRGECTFRITYDIFQSGYVQIESYYEGFPSIDFHLKINNLQQAKAWTDSLLINLGYTLTEIESTDSSYTAQLYKTTDRRTIEGQVDVLCTSAECVVSPSINLNY